MAVTNQTNYPKIGETQVSIRGKQYIISKKIVLKFYNSGATVEQIIDCMPDGVFIEGKDASCGLKSYDERKAFVLKCLDL